LSKVKETSTLPDIDCQDQTASKMTRTKEENVNGSEKFRAVKITSKQNYLCGRYLEKKN